MGEHTPRMGSVDSGRGFLRSVSVPLDSLGVYVHVPFCAKRCTYCDFYSLGQGDQLTADATEHYLVALTTQMRSIAGDLPATARTIYIGGGTPSLLGERIADVVGTVREVFGFDPGAEITVEVNPDDLSAELVSCWLKAGVNRVSVGVQALDDDVLALFGRRHTSAEALRALELLSECGVRWSVDLIAGIPGVSDAVWATWLRRILLAGARHVSIYPLTVEEGTVLAARIESGESPEPDPDSAANQMLLAERELARGGLRRYEIANFAVPGEESRHNLSYWTGVPYIGVGPSASSMVPTPSGGRVRLTLHSSLEQFLASPERATGRDAGSMPDLVEELSQMETLREDVMLRLRTESGVANALAEQASVVAVLTRLADDGLVARAGSQQGGAWHLTERGWLMGNEVFGAVLFD